VGWRVTVFSRDYGYLGLMTLRFDNREYPRTRSFRILEPRALSSRSRRTRALECCTVRYIRGIHVYPRVHSRDRQTRERFRRFRRAGLYARPSRRNCNVAARFIEVSHNIARARAREQASELSKLDEIAL